MYELIIVGAGPAGITAGVYAARKKMDFLVITKDIGGQAAWSGDIENYTGYQFISGPDLVSKFEEHMRNYNIRIKENEEVEEVAKVGDKIIVHTNKGEYESRAVIVASGKRSKELGVPGEKEFKNKGLTYCATCDGPLFSNKNVAVVGGGNSALDAVIQLVKIARHTYIINASSSLGGDAIMRQKIEADKNVTIHNQAKVTEITGDKMVEGIRVDLQGRQEDINVEGVFIEIGLIPNSDFVKDVQRNEHSEIKIDSYNQTSIPGIFAAGDVTDIVEKQIIIAAGEGSKACLGVFKYLSQNKF